MAFFHTTFVLTTLALITVVLSKIVQMVFFHTTFVPTNLLITLVLMEQHAFKNVNNSLNTNVYSYSETSNCEICNLYLNIIHFFNTSVN